MEISTQFPHGSRQSLSVPQLRLRMNLLPAGTQLYLIMHENLDHSTTATETFGNPSSYKYASTSCNSGPFAITHKAGRSMVDSSTRSGIKEAGLAGQRTVTPAIFCRSRRLAETLVSISCTRVLWKMIGVR
jgi:hypothetical protein